jgi:transcriptional regulator with XRE-family HTH domain
MVTKKTIKDRILECIGNQSPTPWGKSIGLGSGTVTKIFKYEEPPSVKHLITISKALGRSIDWLLTGEDLVDKQAHDKALQALDKSIQVRGKVHEDHAVYAGRHEKLVAKFIEILDGPNRSNATAITQNVNTFHKTKDIHVSEIEAGGEEGCDGGLLKKNRRNGERRSQAG